jgi:hypothetical protein
VEEGEPNQGSKAIPTLELVMRALEKFSEGIVTSCAAKGVPPDHPLLKRSIFEALPLAHARFRLLSVEQLEEYLGPSTLH